MACYRPLDAWQTESGKIVFKETADNFRRLQLPCGQCIGCRLERSRQWAVRCMHESQMHKSSAFVTLTYDDVHVPASLEYRDFQLFMKRLRKVGDVTGEVKQYRFYMCGEYGEVTYRPHFHALLFGAVFDRWFVVKQNGDHSVWSSRLLRELWPFGNSSHGAVTFQSAAYVSRYVCKKVTGAAAERHYERVDPRTGEIVCVVPEFTRMSLKPGIGAGWIRKFHAEVYPSDRVRVNGVWQRPPRYYDKWAVDSLEPGVYGDVEVGRMVKADRGAADQTPERLVVRERVAESNFRRFARDLE